MDVALGEGFVKRGELLLRVNLEKNKGIGFNKQAQNGKP